MGFYFTFNFHQNLWTGIDVAAGGLDAEQLTDLAAKNAQS